MLKNLKILDASSVLAGPSVATFFAELGAEVTKIEHPKHADVTRSWKLPSEDESSEVSAYFSSVNYKKNYIKLDLKQSDDRDKFLQLIESTDILITNFKKGDVEKFGIEGDVLFQVNPRLIHGKINGYGSESDRVAYDLILQAESGFMSMNGAPESGPVKMPVALIDILAAHHLKEGILLALYERETSGKGKAISVSLYDAALSSLTNQASNYLMGGKVPQRIGSLHPNIAPYGEIFETKDSALITFAIGSDNHFQKLCTELGLTSLLEKEEFSNNQNRVKNRTVLATFIGEKVKQLYAEPILKNLQALNVPAGKIKTLDEVFEAPEAQELIREEIINDVETKRVTSVIFK